MTAPARIEPQLRAVRADDGHTTYYVGDAWCWSPTAAFSATGLTGDFARIPEFYRERGSAVAKAIELHECGDLDEESVDQHVRPRLDQWKRFVDREVSCVHGVELVTWAWADAAHTIPYVAIIDAVVSMRRGGLRSLNAKCGKNKRVYELQTAAEAYAFATMLGESRAPERGVLELGEDDYRWVPHRKGGDFDEVLRMFCELGPRREWKDRNAA
jgi:hypothetical protein